MPKIDAVSRLTQISIYIHIRTALDLHLTFVYFKFNIIRSIKSRREIAIKVVGRTTCILYLRYRDGQKGRKLAKC